MIPSNVDDKADARTRAEAMCALLKYACASLDAALDTNVLAFLMHVAWHEGARIKKRREATAGTTPSVGRGFFMFEPVRAKETIGYAHSKKWVGHLAEAVQRTEQDVTEAGKALPSSGRSWPQGSLVEQWLVTRDAFASLMVRAAFRKVADEIPGHNAGHALYWAKHWYGNEGDMAKRKQFQNGADELDSLFVCRA